MVLPRALRWPRAESAMAMQGSEAVTICIGRQRSCS